MIIWRKAEVVVKTSNACAWQNDEFLAKRCVRSQLRLNYLELAYILVAYSMKAITNAFLAQGQ